MGSSKKTKKEKAETRKAQNQRAAERKKMQGLTRVTLWMPADALEAAQAASRPRIGIVIAGENASLTPTVYIKKADGSLEEVPHHKTLFET